MVKPVVTEGKSLMVTPCLPPLLCVLCSLSCSPAHGPHRHKLDLFSAFESCHAKFTHWLRGFQVCMRTHAQALSLTAFPLPAEGQLNLSETNTRNIVQREQKVGCIQQGCDSIVVIFSFSVEGSRSTLKSYFLTHGFLS